MKLIDMHCDTLWRLSDHPDMDFRRGDLCVDLDKMQKAGSIAQFFACFIYMDDIVGEDPWRQGYEKALNMINCGKKLFADYSHAIALAKNNKDFLECQAEGKIAAFLTVEEGGILDGDLRRLEHLYQEGVRLLTLTWNHENCIGYPNSRDKVMMERGLKEFGFQVVEKMNELGMLIDVSHLSDGGFWDVLRTSKMPVVASHSNARALCNHPRNLSDEMIRALSDQGGITGVNVYPYFVQPEGQIKAEDIAKHIAHIYNVGGEDVVAMGTDFDGFDNGVSDVNHIGQMGLVYDIVKRQGFTERQMEKFWHKNAMRVIQTLG
jgi:membrane dipeptidase